MRAPTIRGIAAVATVALAVAGGGFAASAQLGTAPDVLRPFDSPDEVPPDQSPGALPPELDSWPHRGDPDGDGVVDLLPESPPIYRDTAIGRMSDDDIEMMGRAGLAALADATTGGPQGGAVSLPWPGEVIHSRPDDPRCAGAGAGPGQACVTFTGLFYDLCRTILARRMQALAVRNARDSAFVPLGPTGMLPAQAQLDACADDAGGRDGLVDLTWRY